MVALVDDHLAVVSDEIGDHALLVKRLDDGDIDRPSGPRPSAADQTDLRGRHVEEGREALAPLIHELAAMHEHEGADAASGDWPGFSASNYPMRTSSVTSCAAAALRVATFEGSKSTGWTGQWASELEDFLRSGSLTSGGAITHGSTIATNAVLEKKVGKVGMIVTKGFRDVLLFRDGPIKNPFDFQIDFPEPYIPRYLTLPVNERINAEGGIDTPLDEQGVLDAVEQFRAWDVDTIAVCLSWSVANPGHEQRIREIIAKIDPSIEVILSCEVNPCIREYRRWVSAAMDASLKRLIATYCRRVNRRMNEAGFEGEVGMLNSTGGVGSAEELIARPLYAIDSGPALAPVAGARLSQTELGDADAVVLDMGGTTFDVSCVRDGVCAVSREAKIGWEIPGMSRVNVHSIGAGGGSMAWVDVGGMVRVGPQSAGSQPGPACYDRGGTQATVTDANVVLGYLDPDYFNDGKMNLRVDLAEKAIAASVAEPLGLSLEEAAFTIWTTVNANMVTAIKDITIWQGIDPRGFVMVVGGGVAAPTPFPSRKDSR